MIYFGENSSLQFAGFTRSVRVHQFGGAAPWLKIKLYKILLVNNIVDLQCSEVTAQECNYINSSHLIPHGLFTLQYFRSLYKASSALKSKKHMASKAQMYLLLQCRLCVH